MPWTIRIAMFVGALTVCVSAVGLWSQRDRDPGVRPARLRVMVLPDVAPEMLRTAYGPLVEHLSRVIDIPCDLEIAADYQDLVDRFGRGEADLAWFGALTFLQALRRHGAVPLVMRDVDTRFTSVFLARMADDRKVLEDFKGSSLALGSELSTSGYLMPRHFLEQRGLPIETTFPEAHHHRGHDVVARHVLDGDVDLGVANGLVIERMFASGRLSRDELVIVERTPPYVDYVWAVRPSLRGDVRREIREAFLELDAMDREQAPFLEAQGCGGYVPVGEDEFEVIAGIAERLELLEKR